MNDSLKLVIGIIAAVASAFGYGLLVAAIMNWRRQPKSGLEKTLPEYGLMGIAILTAIQMTEHFFVSLGPAVNLVTLLVGVVSFVVLFRRRFLIEIPVVTLMIWWAVQFSRTGEEPYDNGLYHLQSMLWNTLDSAVPGLANLHTRLGFDSSLFVLAAGLNIPDLGGQALSFLASALIEAMIAAEFVLCVLSSQNNIARLYSFFALALLLAEPRLILDPTYMSPDPVVAMGVLYAVLLFLDKRNTALWQWAPFVITLKLAAAPLLLLPDWRESVRKHRTAFLIGSSILAIWVARNIVLSGHLLFPVTQTKLPVAWAVGKERTVEAADWITSWARMPGKQPSETRGLVWLEPWAKKNFADPRFRVSATIFLAGIFLLIWKMTFRKLPPQLLCALGFGLAWWFITAPDLRFGAGFIFASSLVMVAYGVDSIDLLRLDRGNARIVTSLLVCWMSVSAALQEAGSPWPNIPHPAVRSVVTPAGARIWMPVTGDQCWSVIPCSPESQAIQYYPKRAALRAPAQ